MHHSKVRFQAQKDKKLLPHIKAAFIIEVEILSSALPTSLLRGHITYQCKYEDFDWPSIQDKEILIRSIASFQQWHDGTNWAVIRPFKDKQNRS